MSERELPPDLIIRLVQAGRSQDVGAALAQLITPAEQLSAGEIMRCCKVRWYALAQSQPADDLEALIHALTVAESSLDGWRAGSVSPAIWTFSVFARRPERAGDLADWVLARTDNHYLPFGSSNFGARSRDELARRRREDAEWREAIQRAEIERATSKRRAAKATHDLANAVRRGDLKAVDALLSKGADPRVCALDGASMLDLARHSGREAVIARIEAALSAVDESAEGSDRVIP
jgi:hypothetical protein